MSKEAEILFEAALTLQSARLDAMENHNEYFVSKADEAEAEFETLVATLFTSKA
jgi:hypothetical protein